MQRREALRSALLRNLQAGSRIDSKFQSVTSTPRRGDPHGTTGDTEQASSTFETGGSIDQKGSGFRPEEWSTGWGGSDLPHVDYHHTYKPKYIRGGPLRVRSPGSTSYLQDVESPSEHKLIAQLAHGLSRVLFNPGVHWLQDPRSRVYKITPWLEVIPKVNDFTFESVTGFVRSSQDNVYSLLYGSF
ncbi:hypothetical protein EDC04DRAFT_840190 [Pisolithus marmoratus]|nr:hypothetical protein EDC04DRAFT_840190 [Pisolithus marmoratus]